MIFSSQSRETTLSPYFGSHFVVGVEKCKIFLHLGALFCNIALLALAICKMLDSVGAERFLEPVQAASSHILSFAEGAKLLAHSIIHSLVRQSFRTLLGRVHSFPRPQIPKELSSWEFTEVCLCKQLSIADCAQILCIAHDATSAGLNKVHVIPKYSIHCLLTKSMMPPWCPSIVSFLNSSLSTVSLQVRQCLVERWFGNCSASLCLCKSASLPEEAWGCIGWRFSSMGRYPL